jgi:hypothetical protein
MRLTMKERQSVIAVTQERHRKAGKKLKRQKRDVDEWLVVYNHQRPHSGRYCYGKTPMQTFSDSKRLAEAKMLDRQQGLVGQHDTRAAVS